MPQQWRSNPSSRSTVWRVKGLLAAVMLVWLVLAGRIVQLQWFSGMPLKERASQQRSYTETIPARPGDIVDRHGRLLATTINTRSLFLNPSQIEHPHEVAVQLGDALGMKADTIENRILANKRKQFIWVLRRLSEEQVENVRTLSIPKHMWGFRIEYARRYPQGRLAAHVLGLRDIDGRGRGGVEQQYDALIRGRDGRRMLVRDARGRVIDIRDRVATAPRHGRTVQLSIDTVIQMYAEQNLDRVMDQWKPKSACAIVLEPKTCEVLAMASLPSFDPNNPAAASGAAWKNTAISAMYEPGSTFKPLIVAWALQKGMLQPEDTFNCEFGAYRMGDRVLHDHHKYGVLDVTDILVRSSNIGMAKIGELLTNRELYNATIAFGFGRQTGSELPGELSGLVRRFSRWDSYSTGSVPMGQEVAVTPLQLITAHAALANGGTLLNPRVVLSHRDSFPVKTATSEPIYAREPIVSSVIDQEKAQWIIQGPLTQVVERGTGRSARLNDYIVFGKTGTAQKLDLKTGKYSSRLHVSSFICGAPANDPRVLVLVVVDEPSVEGNHFGGTVAAPAAASLLHKTLVHLRVPTNQGLIREAGRDTPLN